MHEGRNDNEEKEGGVGWGVQLVLGPFLWCNHLLREEMEC